MSVYSSFRIGSLGGGGGGKEKGTLLFREAGANRQLWKKIHAISAPCVYSAKSAFDSFFSHPFFFSSGAPFCIGIVSRQVFDSGGRGGGGEAERQLLINCSYIGPYCISNVLLCTIASKYVHR